MPQITGRSGDHKQFLFRHSNSTLADGKVLIVGDFNARVRWNSVTWEEVLRRPGVGNYDGNGRLVLEFCTKYKLAITNTVFRQLDRQKTTWMHHWSKDLDLLDYMFCVPTDHHDVLHTRVMPTRSAALTTDSSVASSNCSSCPNLRRKEIM